MTNPKAVLEQGCGILSQVVEPHGFRFKLGNVGRGSGGYFASGFYVRGDRKLELHFRHSLGLVRYHFGVRAIGHEDLMWAFLGAPGGNRYPGFGRDPLDGFRDLAYDLKHHAKDFLCGSDGALTEQFDRAWRRRKPKGLKGLDP